MFKAVLVNPKCFNSWVLCQFQNGLQQKYSILLLHLTLNTKQTQIVDTRGKNPTKTLDFKLELDGFNLLVGCFEPA